MPYPYCIDEILSSPAALHKFFFVECRPMLTYIGEYFFNTKYTAAELTGELYELLAKDDWHKLRIFKGESSLMTYVTVIATRYFLKKRDVEQEVMDIMALPPAQQRTEVYRPEDSFLMRDVDDVMKKMGMIDRFLLQRILIDGEKPRDILEETAELLHRPCDKDLAGYIYTRYNRARATLKQEMIRLGYDNR